MALAVVGLIKPPLARDWTAELELIFFSAPEAGLAANGALADLILELGLFSLKLVLIVEDSLDDGEAAEDGGLRMVVGPILEPLELLLLAGTRVPAVRVGVPVFCRSNGFLLKADELLAAVCGFSGIFFTVFVETALFNDDLELLKLVRELLLSTSLLSLLADGAKFDVSGLRNEPARRGGVAKGLNEVVAPLTRIERDRSRVC